MRIKGYGCMNRKVTRRVTRNRFFYNEMKRGESKVIKFVTGNKNKLREVQQILGDSFPLESVDIDLPELQGSPVDISKEKCRLALAEVGGPVMVEDTSLCFTALGDDLPGPYIKWFLKASGHEGLNKMLVGFANGEDDSHKNGYAMCVFSFCAGEGEEIHTFIGKTEGKIVDARGPTDFGWDPIFEPNEGEGKTYAEMEKTAKNAISHRGRSVAKLQQFLEENPGLWK